MVNRSVTWAEWDEELLALELQEIQEADFDLSLTGFNPGEIVIMAAIAATIMPSWLKIILESPDRLGSIITWANWGIVTTLLTGALLTAFVIWAGSVRDELLKAQAAPRGLSAAQEGILSSDMASLGHQRIDFFLYPNDPEILGIAEPIARALERDGWPVVAFQPLGGGNVSGMLVEYDPTNPDATHRAIALVASLSRLRLAVQGPAATLPTPLAGCL